MLQYEKVIPPTNQKESDKECFDCMYKYPASSFTHDQSGFLCNGCSDFNDKHGFDMGDTTVVKVNGDKYRVWY